MPPLPASLALLFITPSEWVIILVVLLLLFGRRLPELGKALGLAIISIRNHLG